VLQRVEHSRVGAVVVSYGTNGAVRVVLLVVVVVEAPQQHGNEQHDREHKRACASLQVFLPIMPGQSTIHDRLNRNHIHLFVKRTFGGMTSEAPGHSSLDPIVWHQLQ
jgi:hypothetical protein